MRSSDLRAKPPTPRAVRAGPLFTAGRAFRAARSFWALLFVWALAVGPAPAFAQHEGEGDGHDHSISFGNSDDDHVNFPQDGFLHPKVKVPAGWVQVNTKHLAFYFAPQYREAVQPLIDIGDREWERIENEIGLKAAYGSHVLVAKDTDEYLALQPSPFVSKYTLGVTYPRLNAVILRIAGIGDQPDRQLKETFVHELSHAVLDKAVGKNVPRWLQEGLAMHHAREWNVDRFATLVRARVTGGLYPLSELTWKWPEGNLSQDIAYAQSIEFVNYLLDISRKEGGDKFPVLFNKMRAGANFFDAVKVAYGVPLEELENDYRSKLTFWYAVVPFATGSGFLWVLITLGFMGIYGVKRGARAKKRALMAARDEAEDRAREALERAIAAAQAQAASGSIAGAETGDAPLSDAVASAVTTTAPAGVNIVTLAPDGLLDDGDNEIDLRPPPREPHAPHWSHRRPRGQTTPGTPDDSGYEH
jgi:hypothetical protein